MSPYILTLTLLVAAASAQEFCWKDTTTRGVGTVPRKCKSDEDRIGLLCYKKCGKNMKRFGFDCHSVCPDGFRNDGLFCRKTEYGRGAGFPWKFGDGLNDKGMFKRCEKKHGKGNCEKNGAIVYPKCRSGYDNFGCCICRPKKPNCRALGLNPGIDLSCAKKVDIGNPKPGQCNSNQSRDAGLCYPKCGGGFKGIGPVCWGKPPKGWVNCGMGAARDSATCASTVFNQVSSVGQVAIFVATLGSSSAVSAADSAADAGKLAELKKKFEEMKKAYDKIKELDEVKKAIKAAEDAKKIKKGVRIADELNSAVTPEDMARVAALIASFIDPSGVSDTVAAFTYPKCSDYFS